MSAIWDACQAAARQIPLSGSCWRMVESQEEVATRQLVSSLEKQATLERMLEETKPQRRDNGALHYLLATPFRYPPLRHGSRFGGRHEPSLFYAAIDRSSLLAESSYYRFVFRAGLTVPFAQPVASHHTAFAARFETDRGIALEAPPFDAFEAELRSPTDYAASQALGSRLRAALVEAITFRSARDPEKGRNVGLFTPDALASRRPEQQATWSCETTDTLCIWREQGAHDVVRYELENFLVDGHLPMPAL